MASKLQEKRSLVRMAQALGQAPDPQLLEDIERLERIENRIKQNIAADLTEIFSVPVIQETVVEVAEPTPMVITKPDAEPEIVFQEQVTLDVASQVAQSISRQLQTEEGTLVRPEAQMPAATAALEQKVKYLENWISRIAATGPGGGAASTITLDYPVTTVTTSSYTINRKDYYVGVNTASPVTIVLPATGVKSGRNLIIKDESGHCSINPITLTGTIDNDTSGAILAIDNGGLHLIYNTGWRII
jgi:hypothetical protein